MNKNAVYAIGLGSYMVAMAILAVPAHAQAVNSLAKCVCVCQSKSDASDKIVFAFAAPGGDPRACGSMNGTACNNKNATDMTLNSCGGRVDNSGRPVPTPPGPRFTPPPGGWQVQ